MNGNEKVTSNPGLCFSFMLVITLLIFAMSRLPFLIAKKNPMKTQYIETDVYTVEDVVHLEEMADFNIAFTVVGY